MKLWMRELTTKERRFADHYLTYGNKAAAYRFAYPGAKDQTARSGGKDVMRRPCVANYVDQQLQQERIANREKFHEITTQLEEIAMLGRSLRESGNGDQVPVGLPAAVSALAELNRMYGHHAPTRVENAVSGEIKGFNEFYKE